MDHTSGPHYKEIDVLGSCFRQKIERDAQRYEGSSPDGGGASGQSIGYACLVLPCAMAYANRQEQMKFRQEGFGEGCVLVSRAVNVGGDGPLWFT